MIRLAVPLILLWTLALSAIHTQPFDDQGFRASLFADKCLSPCFLDIQPGVTTAAQASDLLEKGGYVFKWIEALQPLDSQADDTSISTLHWQWSKKRPAFLTGTDASLTYNRKTGIVISFGDMGTHLSFGQIFALLGQPAVGFMSGSYNDRDGSTFIHAVGYPQWQLNVISNLQCPMTLDRLWEAPVTLQIAPTAAQTVRFTAYPPHIQAIMGYVADAFC